MEEQSLKKKNEKKSKNKMLSLRVELKTSRLLNGCSNQLSYESLLVSAFVLFINRKVNYSGLSPYSGRIETKHLDYIGKSFIHIYTPKLCDQSNV